MERCSRSDGLDLVLAAANITGGCVEGALPAEDGLELGHVRLDHSSHRSPDDDGAVEEDAHVANGDGEVLQIGLPDLLSAFILFLQQFEEIRKAPVCVFLENGGAAIGVQTSFLPAVALLPVLVDDQVSHLTAAEVLPDEHLVIHEDRSAHVVAEHDVETHVLGSSERVQLREAGGIGVVIDLDREMDVPLKVGSRQFAHIQDPGIDHVGGRDVGQSGDPDPHAEDILLVHFVFLQDLFHTGAEILEVFFCLLVHPGYTVARDEGSCEIQKHGCDVLAGDIQTYRYPRSLIEREGLRPSSSCVPDGPGPFDQSQTQQLCDVLSYGRQGQIQFLLDVPSGYRRVLADHIEDQGTVDPLDLIICSPAAALAPEMIVRILGHKMPPDGKAAREHTILCGLLRSSFTLL